MPSIERVQESEIVDVLVIGGGPAGATAALYAARAGRRCRVVDKGVASGALGMSHEIANFPGLVEPVAGRHVVELLRSQASRYGAEFVTDRVTAARVEGSTKAAYGVKGKYEGRTLIVATGATGRLGHIAGEERLVGRGVSYCATCDGFFFRDQVVAVVGTTDEAAEEALLLARLARHVYLLVPTEALQAPSELAAKIEANPSIEVHRSTVVDEILGAERVEALQIRSRGGAPSRLAVDGVFLYLQGARPIVDFLGGQAGLSADGCLLVDEYLQTTIPGVFAAGDVLCKHLKQAVIAAAEGARAAVAADRHLAGHAKLRPDWS